MIDFSPSPKHYGSCLPSRARTSPDSAVVSISWFLRCSRRHPTPISQQPSTVPCPATIIHPANVSYTTTASFSCAGGGPSLHAFSQPSPDASRFNRNLVQSNQPTPTCSGTPALCFLYGLPVSLKLTSSEIPLGTVHKPT